MVRFIIPINVPPMKILCAHQCYNKDKTFCLLPFYSVLVYPKQEKTGIGNTIILKDESCGDLQNQRCENQLTIHSEEAGR